MRWGSGWNPDHIVDVLLTIDPLTGLGTQIGPTNIGPATVDMCPITASDLMADIAFRSDGTLFGFTPLCNALGTIDLTTGAFTPLPTVNPRPNNGNGIAFSSGDVLFHANQSNLSTLNQTTGALTPVAPLTFPVGCTGLRRMAALDFERGTGRLFGVLNCDGASWRLATIDTATGLVTEIGPTANHLDALAFQTIGPPLTAFRDGRRPNDIKIGPDLGGTTHQALNFTGTTGTAGDTWITVYDPAPNPPPVTFGSVRLSADVLIHTFNNKKGAGLLALYNEATSKKGLALTLYNAGNTDTLVLATVDQAGKLVTLNARELGRGHHGERVVPRQHGGGRRRRPRERHWHCVQARDADRPRQPAHHHTGGADAYFRRHARGPHSGRRRCDRRSWHSGRRRERCE